MSPLTTSPGHHPWHPVGGGRGHPEVGQDQGEDHVLDHDLQPREDAERGRRDLKMQNSTHALQLGQPGTSFQRV